jgi:hypothetical protein
MEFDDRGFALLDLPSPAPALLESFGHLEFDEYAGHSRYRRFGQYRLTPTPAGFALRRLPPRRYVAPREFNRLVGGIARDYAPLTADFTGCVRWIAQRIPLDSVEWQADVHQIRVLATPGKAGVVVPEGPHQDGHEFVFIAVFDRHRVTGGELRLTTLENRAGEPFFAGVVPAGRGVVLKDTELCHDVTAIEPVGERGWRDTLVVPFTRWSERKYGAEFDARETVGRA